MDKEEVIEKYIEHIRNISELSDEEIESVVEDAIVEDEELLDILEQFLVKRENIKEKIVELDVIKEEKEEKDNEEQEEKEEKDNEEEEEKEEKDNEEEEEEQVDLLNTFDEVGYAYPLDDILERLKITGYTNPSSVVTDAIDDLLYVDSLDDDGTVYFALTEKGEKLWESMH